MLQAFRSSAKWIWYFVVATFVVGFVFYGTSGLSGRPTRTSAVGKVNGTTITYDTYMRAVQSRLKEEERQRNTALTLDDNRQIEDATFNSMVDEILLDQELKRRGITVTDEEIQRAALSEPPPELQRSPEFQTEGRFDLEKYQRFLRSPIAKQQGLLLYLESFYRSEIPKQKLGQLIASGVYVTDAQLWRTYQDANDSAQVSFVALTPESVPDSAVSVSEDEIKTYFTAHEKEMGTRPGRAVLTVTMIPRTITAADSAAVRARAVALRNEVMGGAKFEDVAKRESADSVSAANGGALGKIVPHQMVAQFEKGMNALKVGEVSQPVLSPFGYHIIRVDSRKGDTTEARHIMLRIQQSDSSAARSDKLADQLTTQASGSGKGAQFDSTLKRMGLTETHVVAIEGEPVIMNGRQVPSVSAWAFGSAKRGDVSDLYDSEDGYFMARLDSVTPGGKATVEMVHDEVKRVIAREKKTALLVKRLQPVAQAVASGKTLEQAAQAAGVTVEKTSIFSRLTPVPVIGQLNEVIGAAFGLPVGAVSEPIDANTGAFVIRVDKRVVADRGKWEAQKKAQRQGMMAQLQQRRVQEFMANLRQSANIDDQRKRFESQQVDDVSAT